MRTTTANIVALWQGTAEQRSAGRPRPSPKSRRGVRRGSPCANRSWSRAGDAGILFGTGAGSLAGNGFFAVRQSGAGGGRCGAGTDDLFGCGNVGATPDPLTCAPLDRFSNDLCAALPPTWSCGIDSANEMNNVIETSGEGGGVLCCRD